jgi:hypothetical protein
MAEVARMNKKQPEEIALSWLGANFNEKNLDTLIDFTIAMVENGNEELGEDAISHAHYLAMRMGFNPAQSLHIINTVVENVSHSLSISGEAEFVRTSA